jgi:hypothetical protein
MFPLSLDYSLMVSVFHVPNVSLVIRLFIVGLCVSCTQCFPCHWIIHCWSLCFLYPMFRLPLDYSLFVSVFPVPNVSLVIRLFIVGLCVSCTQCFPCHWTIHCWLPLWFSLTYFRTFWRWATIALDGQKYILMHCYKTAIEFVLLFILLSRTSACKLTTE